MHTMLRVCHAHSFACAVCVQRKAGADTCTYRTIAKRSTRHGVQKKSELIAGLREHSLFTVKTFKNLLKLFRSLRFGSLAQRAALCSESWSLRA